MIDNAYEFLLCGQCLKDMILFNPHNSALNEELLLIMPGEMKFEEVRSLSQHHLLLGNKCWI